ncbi:MAG: phage tail tape measure protein [Bacteroidia bacterium]|nr:phage tail tape measure protein [Bacteroidia bacterium]
MADRQIKMSLDIDTKLQLDNSSVKKLNTMIEDMIKKVAKQNPMKELEESAKIVTEKIKQASKEADKLVDNLTKIESSAKKLEEPVKNILTKIKDAAKNAASLDSAFNRIAFVMTAKMSYKVFDAINQGLREGRKNAVLFEAELARITSIASGRSAQPLMPAMRSALELGFHGEDIAKAAYQSVSAQFTPSETAKLMKTAEQMAVAGKTELSQSFDLLTTILNSYKMSVDDATHVSDVFFKTIQYGKTSVQEFAPNIGKVISTASLLGITFEEVSAAISTMTLNGIQTNVAITSLAQLLASMVRPTKQAQDVLDRHNISLDIAQVKVRGFAKTIEELNALTDEEISRVAGSVRGFRAMATAITSNTQWQENYNQMMNASGATQEAFNRQLETTDMRLKRFRGAISSASLSAGELITALSGILTPLTNVMYGFDKWTIGIPIAAAGLYGLVRAIMAVTAALKAGDVAMKQNLIILGISAAATIAIGIYGKYKKAAEDAHQAQLDWAQANVERAHTAVLNTEKEIKVLNTYIKLKEEESRNSELSKDKTILLGSAQNELKETYQYTADNLVNYNDKLAENMKLLGEQRKEVLKTRAIYKNIELEDARKTLQKIKIKGPDSAQGVLGSISEMVSSSTIGYMLPESEEDIKAAMKQIKDIQDEHFANLKEYNKKATEMQTEIVKEQDKFRTMPGVVYPDMFGTQEDIDKTTQKVKIDELIGKRKNIVKEIGKYTKAITPSMQALLDVYDALKYLLPDTDEERTAAYKLSRPELRDGNNLLAKDPFKDFNWKTAKRQFEQNELDLDGLIKAKEEYYKKIETYTFDDQMQAEYLKETADTDMLTLIERRFNNELRVLEYSRRSASTVDSIIEAEEKISEAYGKYIKNLKEVNANKIAIQEIEEKKNAIFGKTNVATITAHKQREEQLKKDRYAADIKFVTDEKNQLEELANLYHDAQKMQTEEIQSQMEEHKTQLVFFNGLEQYLKNILDARKKINALVKANVQAKLDEQVSFGAGLLSGAGINTHYDKQVMLDELKKQIEDENMKTPDLVAQEKQLAKEIQMEAGKDIVSHSKDLTSELGDIYQAYLDRRLKQIDIERQAALSSIDEQAKMQYRSTWWVQREKEKAEREAEKQRKKVMKQQKMVSIAESTMNTAIGVTNVWAKWAANPAIAAILTALVMGVGAAQIATIDAQKFAQGGWVGGKSHAQGGTIIEAEKDEFVYSTKATKGNERFIEYMHNSLKEGAKPAELLASNVLMQQTSQKPVQVVNNNKELVKEMRGIVNSIKDIKVEVAMHGEFIDNVKLARRVELGNKQRRTV